MLVSRDTMCTFGWILALTLSMAGCQSAPEQITSKSISDDFGEVLPNQEEITVESVQNKEMLHNRAQAEFRLGPAFAFDLFDPTRDAYTDVGITAGGKLQLETAKNIYMGLSVDWTDANVQEGVVLPIGPGGQPGEEQILGVVGYDRLSILGTIDYDIPVTETRDGLILRLGMGVGMCFVDFNSSDQFTGNAAIEDIYQIMFRPSIGLRYPVSEHLLIFSELTYDIVPERTMATQDDEALLGPRAILSAGTVLFGVSYQW